MTTGIRKVRKKRWGFQKGYKSWRGRYLLQPYELLHSLERKFKPVVHIVRFQVSCELCGKGLWGHHNRSMRAHLFYPLHYRSQGQLNTVWSLTLSASVTLLLHQPHKHKLQGLCQGKAATCLGHLPWTNAPPPRHFNFTLFPGSFPRRVFVSQATFLWDKHTSSPSLNHFSPRQTWPLYWFLWPRFWGKKKSVSSVWKGGKEE